MMHNHSFSNALKIEAAIVFTRRWLWQRLIIRDLYEEKASPFLCCLGIEFITRWFLKQLLHDRAPTPVRLVRPSLSYTNHLIAKQARAADRREGRPVALASACLGVILLRGAVNKKPDMVASEAKLALPLQYGRY